MTFWNNEQQVQKITIHAWCLIFPCLQAKNPKILALTNLHFLSHVKKSSGRNTQRKIRNTSLISSVGGCLLAEGWQGACFTRRCSLQPASSRASTRLVTEREEHLCTWCCMVRWHVCCHGYHSEWGEVPVRDQFTSPDWCCHQREGKLPHKSQQRLNTEHK